LRRAGSARRVHADARPAGVRRHRRRAPRLGSGTHAERGYVRVLACDGIDPAALSRIRAGGHEVIEAKGLAAPDLLTALRGVQGLLVRSATKVTAEVLAGAPDLRVVVRAGTGLDNVDRAAAEARGVIVRNTPNANSVAVAEITFAMLLSLERRIADAAADLRQ